MRSFAAQKLIGVLIVSLVIATLAMRSQRDEARAELAGLGSQITESTRMAEADARTKEKNLRAQSDALRIQLTTEIQNAKDTQSHLVSDLRAGTRRLSIAAHCTTPDPTATDPSTASGSGPEGARAYLDPATAEALVSIASDGDTAIRERNACIAIYESVQQQLSKR